MSDDVAAGVRKFLVELGRADVTADDLTDDYPLIENEVLDSMGIFQLVEMLEDTFDVSIEDDELAPEHFENIAAVVALVQAKRPSPS